MPCDRADSCGLTGNRTRGFRRRPEWKDRRNTPPARRPRPKFAYVLRVIHPPYAHSAIAGHLPTFSAGFLITEDKQRFRKLGWHGPQPIGNGRKAHFKTARRSGDIIAF